MYNDSDDKEEGVKHDSDYKEEEAKHDSDDKKEGAKHESNDKEEGAKHNSDEKARKPNTTVMRSPKTTYHCDKESRQMSVVG